MTAERIVHRVAGACLFASWAVWLVCVGCGRADPDRVQGYVEGEYVYVSSPLAGTLLSLAVARGAQVKQGDLLFALDSEPEQAALEEADRRLAQARANWQDVQKGKRPEEIDSLQAQLNQAQAALALSQRELARQEKLVAVNATSAQNYDRARATRDQDHQRVVQLEADLHTARLGARSDQVRAAEANVHALEAALAKAKWDLQQKRQLAPQAGLVFDTLFRVGEWVAAGRPVVVLLPPQNIKVRAFVPQVRMGGLRVDQQVQVAVDGRAGPLAGTLSFISPQAEFTPPVIYSRESRAKLVYMIEIVFDPQTASGLHPGQPVDVRLMP